MTLAAGRELAVRYGYHEYVFRIDDMEASWSRSAPPDAAPDAVVSPVRQRSLRVGIERLAALR